MRQIQITPDPRAAAALHHSLLYSEAHVIGQVVAFVRRHVGAPDAGSRDRKRAPIA